LSRVPGNTLIFLIAASLLASGRKTEDHRPAALLKHVARTFHRLSQRPRDTVPDAVLNATKCVVVIPHVTSEPGSYLGQGVASCRKSHDQWEDPLLVSFRGGGARSPRSDLLILVLQDAATHALHSGGLRIRAHKHVTAPLVSTTPAPSQVDLAAESLAYEYVPNALYASPVQGTVRLEATSGSPGRAVHGEDKLNEKFLSSLVSFFNSIIPTGIVIHHTAVIPGDSAPPQNRADVDEYHQRRGFEIKCFDRVYHVAYHYLILADGRIQAGRPERCEGAHAQGYNSYLGISVVGDFSSEDNPEGKKGPTRPSQQQIASLVQLCRRLQKRYRIPLKRIVRHRDIASTKCPGDRFPFASFLQQLQTRQSAIRGAMPQ
jgi:lipid-binding SYLF domain-containing protein